MKIIFFGTPEYVVPILKGLYKKYQLAKSNDEIVAVVTQSPKASGRKGFIERSGVDNWAYKHHIDVIYDLNKIPEADLGVVAAYGKIIPKEVIGKFAHGILNVHPSLLPKYRGASPVQAAIAAGDTETGLTIIKMDEKMDHGPIVSRFKEEIKPDDTTESLRDRLFEMSVEFLIELLPNYLNGRIKPKEQDHDAATFTKIINKEDGFIELKDFKDAIEGKNADEINNFIRAMYPWPGAWTLLRLSATEGQAKRLKIINAHVKDGKLVPEKVQLEGKNEAPWKQFRQAYVI